MLQSTSIDIADKRYNWLKMAIKDPEWLATQREAWEATKQLAERHRATAKGLRQIAEAYVASHSMPEEGKPTQSFS